MTFAQRNKHSAKRRHDRQPIILRLCACGHCADCKARQTPEERLRMHLAEVNGYTSSHIQSTLSIPLDQWVSSGKRIKRMHGLDEIGSDAGQGR